MSCDHTYTRQTWVDWWVVGTCLRRKREIVPYFKQVSKSMSRDVVLTCLLMTTGAGHWLFGDARNWWEVGFVSFFWTIVMTMLDKWDGVTMICVDYCSTLNQDAFVLAKDGAKDGSLCCITGSLCPPLFHFVSTWVCFVRFTLPDLAIEKCCSWQDLAQIDGHGLSISLWSFRIEALLRSLLMPLRKRWKLETNRRHFRRHRRWWVKKNISWPSGYHLSLWSRPSKNIKMTCRKARSSTKALQNAFLAFLSPCEFVGDVADIVQGFPSSTSTSRKHGKGPSQILRFISFYSPTAWKAWGSSNKASGWFGAAARNLAPGSERFRRNGTGSEVKVPFMKR